MNLSWDFLSDLTVKYLPCNAENTGLIPGQGSKIPHVREQLSLCVTSRESMKVKVTQLCLFGPHGLYIYIYIQSMEFSRPEY